MSDDRLRVLLWSVNGAGCHYSGPGTSALHLYSAEPGRFRLDLAHGMASHEAVDVFEHQHLIRPFQRGIAGQLAYIRGGSAWMREHASQYDVIHALQAFDFTVTPCLEAERRGTPCAVKIVAHSSDLSDKPGWRGWLKLASRRRERLKRLSAVIAISTRIEQELLDYGLDPKSIAVIPNGVNTDRFFPSQDPSARSAARRALGWPDRPTILCVGQVNVRKRQHLLIGALELAVEQGIDAQIVLVGPSDPEYFAAIGADARRRGVADRLVHTGFTEDPAPAYRAAEIHVLVSSSEGMPNSILEAMSSGLPVVGTPVSGTTDLILPGRTGAFVEPDAGEIAECLVAYLKDPQQCVEHGRAGRERVERDYSVRSVLDAHERLFRNIIDGRPAAEASILKR